MGNSSFAAEAILRAEDVQGRRNVRLLSSCRETRGRRCGGLTSSRREKRKTPMISAGDGQFPRDYSGGASTSPDRRRRSAAAGGADAPNGGLGKLSLGGAARGRQQQANYWSFKSRTPRPSPTRTGRVPGERPDVTADFHAPGGFSRADRLRRSLPLARSSANPAKLHTPGVLFLQLGEETRRVHLTHELCSLDTLRALIVHMFPQRLSMATLRSPGTALLIKDESRNVFYELEDPRDVRDRCVVKIYCKEPAVYGTYPGRRDWRPLANGDLRREMVYAPQDSPPSQRPCPPAAASPPQGSPSRTRFLFGGGGVRPSSYAGAAARRRTASPAFGASSGAILERRDVKPDEEAGGARGVMLLRADERRGGGVYADPYSLGLDACAGLAGTPRSPLPSRGDPYGSLYRRGTGGAAVCSMMEGGGLYRAGGALYDDAHAASVLAVGLHVPPPSSPQNIPDARDAYGGTLPSRGSPSRGERRRDPLVSSAGGDGRRSRGLTSEQLCLMAAAVAGGDGIGGDETETRERMEVMEKQIASLTGLLQRVLSRAAEDHSPEKTESASDGSGTEPATPSAPLALMPPPPPNVSHVQMQRHLLGLQQSTNALRTQLSQLRHVQLSNQDSVMALLRQTEAELSVLTLDAARTHEDPLQRQRLLVEEERRKYLTQEEALAHKLQDLERWVEDLRESSDARPRTAVSQRDLRQKTQELKTLAETLDRLKSQFPGLQSKMRVVLRVEVEAVKFLKEEPQRLDALLRRCDSIRDSLSSLRSQASDREPEDPSGQSQTSCPRGPTEKTPPVSFRSRAGPEKSLNAQAHVSADVTLAAERDWEEKRASLTQFSAQDINRLLEATQAQLLKALPDLDLAAKTPAKPAVPPKPPVEHAAGRVQLAAQKLNSTEGPASRRGSADTGVARCRADKPSKSPPPPPPRRTFPSPLAALNDKSAKTEDGEAPEAPVKLRRTPSDAPRPASALPDDDVGKDVSPTLGGSPASVRGPTVAARLKHLEQGGRKSKEEVRAFPGSQQQVFHF
ncbi:SRC kinase signaling inhibitor 1-like isoform X2 [Syngnathoides biaculeatus]|uniref:SRC kinase signaling inhibitor 1-like isoform X2 n=1 Tax=Syngnathoides biaculeatus TaxID=300417 RepID=UPI002ADDABA5|nr:SRC kinase signaling inhibitor 1-like isoform X2 [Syngnathoides biaculeatus]